MPPFRPYPLDPELSPAERIPRLDDIVKGYRDKMCFRIGRDSEACVTSVRLDTEVGWISLLRVNRIMFHRMKKIKEFGILPVSIFDILWLSLE